MKRITPKDFYLDLPCSVVSIGCASETLHGSFDYGKIKILEIPHAHLGYEHSENGSRRVTDKERKLLDKINKLWDNYISK